MSSGLGELEGQKKSTEDRAIKLKGDLKNSGGRVYERKNEVKAEIEKMDSDYSEREDEKKNV